MTPFQKKMLSLFLEHSFPDYQKNQRAPIGDWNNITGNIIACDKITLFTWREYVFYTDDSLYYHHKKQNIHVKLQYSEINDYNSDSRIIDYGVEHQQISISNWSIAVKDFVCQISKIKTMKDKADTSIFAYCYKKNSDFKLSLASIERDDLFKKIYKKAITSSPITIEYMEKWRKRVYTEDIKKLLSLTDTQIEEKTLDNLMDVLRYIRIRNIFDGKIFLEIGQYISKSTMSDENFDSDAEISHVESVLYTVESIFPVIASVYQEYLYKTFGVKYDIANIKLMNNPNISYEQPSLLDKAEQKISSINSFLEDHTNHYRK